MGTFNTALSSTGTEGTLFHQVMVRLSEEDVESFDEFLAALSNEAITIPNIRAALKKFDIQVSESTLRRWRAERIDSGQVHQ